MRSWKQIVMSLLIASIVASCSGKGTQTQGQSSTPAASGGQVTGAGSSFVFPIMSKWTDEYMKTKPGTQINYQSIGSGAGIQQVTAGTVDFGATDGPMTDEQLKDSKIGAVLHVPVIMGASVVAYNLPGVTGELRLTPALLAGIYLGKVTHWNDPAIQKVNPGVALPNLAILVVHRADGSGTTYIWTDYLSKVSPEWKTKVGTNTAVSWPTGVGAKGNDGVAGNIRTSPGAIGYVEMTYADQNNIPYAGIQNAAGNFVRPSTDGVTAAAASAQIPDDFRYSLTNPSGPDAYPIAGTTWLLIPVNPSDKSRQKVVVDFANWILTAGQSFAPALHYAPLPPALVTRVQQSLAQLQ